METIILCGGLGTRISEETGLRPKPIIEIGGKPILWHLMKCFERFGFTDFTLALGYKADLIKDYFINFHLRSSDFEVDLSTGAIAIDSKPTEKWRVCLVETGADTLTGGRLLRLQDRVKPGETFMLTYGDGLSNVNINELVKFHKSHGKLATVTAVRPTARFGELSLNGNIVEKFEEKPQSSQGWINGGFFVLEPEVFDFIDGDQTILEKEPLERIALEGQLQAFKHDGFWQCMDTIRDKKMLDRLAQETPSPWLKG
jgi:glucose-1-phosphate cytidylyltransferase